MNNTALKALAFKMFAVAMIALAASSVGAFAAATPAMASAGRSFATSEIADMAEKMAKRSRYGGWCKVFVGKVVRAVKGSSPSGYHTGWARAGAVQVSAAKAGRGDIMQVTPSGSTDATAWKVYQKGLGRSSKKLHSAILLDSRHKDGTFSVIDSNWGNNKLIQWHRVNPYKWARGSVIKFWRFGKSDTADDDKPKAQDAPASVNEQLIDTALYCAAALPLGWSIMTATSVRYIPPTSCDPRVRRWDWNGSLLWDINLSTGTTSADSNS